MSRLFPLSIKLAACVRPLLHSVFLGACLAGPIAPYAFGQTSNAANRIATEDAVKAVYLYKFRNYVEWPNVAAKAGTAKMTIGVIGGDDILDRLLAMPAARDRVNGTLSVKHLRIGDSLEGLNVLFIDDAYWPKSLATAAQAAALSILVVTESSNALRAGSVINFRVVDERVRFEVSLESAQQAGLKLSSELLALAVSVVREKRK
jgi:hypothetical protein